MISVAPAGPGNRSIHTKGRRAMDEGHVETNGVRLWYEERGPADGTPIVLIMGVAASALWWPPELVEPLVAAGHRVVAFDNRDAGLSSYVERSYGLDEMTDDLFGLLDGLGIGRAHLAGMSMGGMIAQLAAAGDPDRVASLTLISSTPGQSDSLSPSDESVFADLGEPGGSPEAQLEFDLGLGRALAGWRYPLDEGAYRRLLEADAARGVNPDTGHYSVSLDSRIDQTRTIRVPTLIVHGSEDPIFPFDHAEALAAAIPGSTLVRWEGVGHELPVQLMPELARLIDDHVTMAI
jgi:pimeloyl-ACP methyl ester carboxylesterase